MARRGGFGLREGFHILRIEGSLWVSEVVACSDDLNLEVKANFSPELGSLNCRFEQSAHPHEVISGGRKGKHPARPGDAPMTCLAKHPHRLHPAKHFLDPLPFALADSIAFVPRGASINGAAAAPLSQLRRGHLGSERCEPPDRKGWTRMAQSVTVRR